MTPRFAVAFTFFAFGIGIGLWGGSVAEVSRITGTTPSLLGAAFFGFGIAGLLGFAFGGRIARSVSLKIRLMVLLTLTALSFVMLLHAQSPAWMISALFIFSFLIASVDLVMNAEGVAVERDVSKPVMLGFHAASSFGVAFGSLAGSWISVTFGVSATTIAGVLVLGAAIAIIWVVTPNRGPTQAQTSGSSWFRPSWFFVVLSLVVGSSIAIEIAAINFSANAFTELAPSLAAWAGTGALAYAFVQATIRSLGDRLRIKFGDLRLIFSSLSIAFIGLCILSLAPNFAIAMVGMALIGIGTACIVPTGFAIAPQVAGHAAVSAISVLSVIAAPIRIFMVLVYGEAASHIGFVAAYGVYSVLALIALGLAAWMLRQRPNNA